MVFKNGGVSGITVWRPLLTVYRLFMSVGKRSPVNSALYWYTCFVVDWMLKYRINQSLAIVVQKSGVQTLFISSRRSCPGCTRLVGSLWGQGGQRTARGTVYFGPNELVPSRSGTCRYVPSAPRPFATGGAWRHNMHFTDNTQVRESSATINALTWAGIKLTRPTMHLFIPIHKCYFSQRIKKVLFSQTQSILSIIP